MATANKAAKAVKEPKLISSFEEGCKILEVSPWFPDVSDCPLPEIGHATVERYKLYVGAAAIHKQQNWEADWSDYNQEKWYPVFDLEDYSDGRSGFSFLVFDLVSAYSCVGSRLVFGDKATAQHFVESFMPQYRADYKIEKA